MLNATGAIDTVSQETVYTRVLRSVTELSDMEDEWYSLLERCPSHTIFATPDWLIPIAEVYKDRIRPLTIAVYQAEELVGLAPLAVVRRGRFVRVLCFLGMGPSRYSVSDYLDIIAAEGHETVTARAVLRQVRDLAQEWDVMDLQEIPETSPVLSSFLQEAKPLGWLVKVERRNGSFLLSLTNSWEEFLQSLSSHFRKDIERQARKFEKEYQAQFRILEGEEELDSAIQLLVRLHTAQWHERGLPGIFASEGAQHFLKTTARRMARRGVLQLGLLRASSGPLAINFNLRYRGTVYYYTSGYDPSRLYTKYSLGTLLNRYAINAAIQAGDSVFNFLRGDGAYKARYGTREIKHYRVRFWQGRAHFIANVALEHLRRRARGLIRLSGLRPRS